LFGDNGTKFVTKEETLLSRMIVLDKKPICPHFEIQDGDVMVDLFALLLFYPGQREIGEI